MHDTILLNKILDVISQTCETNRIKKVNSMTIIISNESHINEENLREHLKSSCSNLIGKWTNVDVFKENIQDQTAVIHSIQGEQYD